MIYLSATFIKDFLACSYRAKLRRDVPESAIINDEAIFGGIVHEAIEKFTEYDPALEFCLSEWDRIKNTNNFMKEDKKPPKSFRKMLQGYFEKIYPNLNPDGFKKVRLEHKFEVSWGKGVTLIGKMDRVETGDFTEIYDWKTSMKPPDIYDLSDLQFYIYYIAHKMIHGDEPTVYYGHVYSGMLHRIDINPDLVYNTERLVDHVAARLASGEAYRVTGYQCRSCFYRMPCYNEIRINELDNRTIPERTTLY